MLVWIFISKLGLGPIACVISGTYYHQTLPVNCAQLLNSLENEFLYVYKIHFTIKLRTKIWIFFNISLLQLLFRLDGVDLFLCFISGRWRSLKQRLFEKGHLPRSQRQKIKLLIFQKGVHYGIPAYFETFVCILLNHTRCFL